MIDRETFLNGFRLVIVTQYQRLTADITDSFFFGSCICDMISSTAFQACTASAHTVYNVLIRHIHIDSIINLCSKLCKSIGQALCLRNSPRETIKYIAVLRIILLNAVHNQVTCQLIRNQKSLVHVCLGFLSKLCAFLDICTENITGRNVRYAIFAGNLLCLCSLTSARRSKHDNLHIDLLS